MHDVTVNTETRETDVGAVEEETMQNIVSVILKEI